MDKDRKQNILLGTLLLGINGVLIGVVVHSVMLSIIAGALGAGVGAVIGWLGGLRFILIVCGGVLLGAFIGWKTGDQDILIISAGTGGAMAGMIANQVESFMRK